jgi:hypothetical protein
MKFFDNRNEIRGKLFIVSEEKTIATFENGIFETEDIKVIDKLKELGFKFEEIKETKIEKIKK